MRVLICGLFLLATPAGAERVEPGSRYDPVASRLIDNERRTWMLYPAKDVEGLAALAADDFSDIYPDGTIVDKAGYLADVASVTVKSYALSDFHVFMLTPESAIVTYVARAEGVTPRAGRIRSEVAVTSAWSLRGGQWLNTFYRENVQELNGKRLLPAPTASATDQPRPR